MVALLLDKPASSTSSVTSLQSKPAVESCTTSVHYQLGRRSNCCANSGSSDKSGSYSGSSVITASRKKSTMVVATRNSIVTMAAVILISALFINAALVEAVGAADILSSSPALSQSNHNKFSFTNGNSSNSLFGSGGSSKAGQNPYTHRFKGLERILSRLDGLGPTTRGGDTTAAVGNIEESSNVNSKDRYPVSHQQQNQEQRRFLTGGSNGNGMSITPPSSSAAGVIGGGGALITPSSSGSHQQPQQQRSPTSFNPLASLTGGGFNTPGKTYFDAGEDEDLDEELDDDDSYEENEDEDNPGDELLNDKIMTNWAHSYKNRYLAQRKSPTTTTTSTTTTTPTPTTTTTTTTTPAPPSLSFSQWKWHQLGNRQGLEQYRRHLASGGSSPSVSSNSIYHSPSFSSGNTGGGSGTNYPYHQHNNQQFHHRQGHHTGNGRYGGNTNSNPSPYSPYSSSTSSRSSYSSPVSQGSSWTGGSTRAQPQTPGSALAIGEAVRHALKVRKEASCSVPQPRVVRVQDFYPHPGKTYVPHCTILHQCSDDTGCCRHDTLTCSPKTTQRVELAFYAVSMDHSRAPMVDRLVFYNHTECECRDKLDEQMPRDQQHTPTASSSSSSSILSMTPSLSSPYSDPYSFPSGSSLPRRNAIIDSNSIDDTASQCRCPSAFSQRTLSDGSCSCDCFDKEKKCIRLKRGRDFFSLADKWCIQSGRCEVPECAYGPYIHLIGRCPRKRERSGQTTSWTRYLTS